MKPSSDPNTRPPWTFRDSSHSSGQYKIHRQVSCRVDSSLWVWPQRVVWHFDPLVHWSEPSPPDSRSGWWDNLLSQLDRWRIFIRRFWFENYGFNLAELKSLFWLVQQQKGEVSCRWSLDSSLKICQPQKTVWQYNPLVHWSKLKSFKVWKW